MVDEVEKLDEGEEKDEEYHHEHPDGVGPVVKRQRQHRYPAGEQSRICSWSYFASLLNLVTTNVSFVMRTGGDN